MTDVYGIGPTPCDVMLCGEAPGYHEAHHKPYPQPFVGPSGKLQDEHLARHRLHCKLWYRTNIVKTYIAGNPDPTPQLIDEWSDVLDTEIDTVKPKLIIAVGKCAAQHFLGSRATLELVHGRPQHAGSFDSSIAYRAGPNNAVILPIYHPAAGLHKPDFLPFIAWDYEQVARVYELVKRGLEVDICVDEYAGDEQYIDIGGYEFACQLLIDCPDKIAIDTEGSESDPESIQLSWSPGIAYVLRTDQPDFQLGIAQLQHYVDKHRPVIVFHFAMHDMPVCRTMGLTFRYCQLRDSGYAAYLLRIEPQGLKPLEYRWCGMVSPTFNEVVGKHAKAAQLAYLRKAYNIAVDLPKPEPIDEFVNDGTWKTVRPSHVKNLIKKLVDDIESDKRNNKGEPVDIDTRWGNFRPQLKAPIELSIGKLPVSKSLRHVPLSDFIYYAGRDADATLRVDEALSTQLRLRGLEGLMDTGMECLHAFEEMQAQGMPTDVGKLKALSEELFIEYLETLDELSTKYFNGEPFNPNSNKHARQLLEYRSLQGTKITSTGLVSTSKLSIEHLRYKDPAIELMFKCREILHLRTSFVDPVLESNSQTTDGICHVRGRIKITRTPTRRLAGESPNFLAQPKHGTYGKRLRACYVAPANYVLYAADLSCIEMRVAAHRSNDPVMCEIFNEGRDIHSETAALTNRIPIDQVDRDKHRRPAKTTGFGMLYGEGSYGLMVQLRKEGLEGWTEDKCKDLIRDWFGVFEGFKTYCSELRTQVARDGYIRDMHGMINYLPNITSDDPKLRAEAGRHAVSYDIQGGAQGMIQNSIAYLRPIVRDWQDAGIDVRWLLEIHDELVFLCPVDAVEMLDELVIDALTNHCGVELRVPVVAESSWGPTWGDA